MCVLLKSQHESWPVNQISLRRLEFLVNQSLQLRFLIIWLDELKGRGYKLWHPPLTPASGKNLAVTPLGRFL